MYIFEKVLRLFADRSLLLLALLLIWRHHINTLLLFPGFNSNNRRDYNFTLVIIVPLVVSPQSLGNVLLLIIVVIACLLEGSVAFGVKVILLLREPMGRNLDGHAVELGLELGYGIGLGLELGHGLSLGLLVDTFLWGVGHLWQNHV